MDDFMKEWIQRESNYKHLKFVLSKVSHEAVILMYGSHGSSLDAPN